MDRLHNKDEYSAQKKPEGGLQASLCSNNVLSCGTPLGFTNGTFISEDAALDYFASILVGAFLDQKEYERNQLYKPQTGSDICPSVNEGTS